MEPIGPCNTSVSSSDITLLPDIILGGGALNTQYNDDPTKVPIVDMLKYAFSKGIVAIDTSPYYGQSEVLYGQALEKIKDKFPRETYFICTKVGRIKSDDFDYSRENIRFSVLRSCERLHTHYLDLVYLHDVEFTTVKESIEALTELRKLKDEGIIRNFGLSGYPLEYITKLVIHVREECSSEIGNIDAVLSYCNLNLQNTLLNQYSTELFNQNLKVVCNASILSMSLLRSSETRYFHPCSDNLKECAEEASQYCEDNDIELADLATRYAFSQWLGKGPTVIGVSNLDELKHALSNYWEVKNRGGNLSDEDIKMIKNIQKNIFLEHFDETWNSGIEHPDI